MSPANLADAGTPLIKHQKQNGDDDDMSTGALVLGARNRIRRVGTKSARVATSQFLL